MEVTTEMHESHHLVVNRIRRIWSKVIVENVQNPRDAILISQVAPRCGGTTLSWGRMHMQGHQIRSSRELRPRGKASTGIPAARNPKMMIRAHRTQAFFGAPRYHFSRNYSGVAADYGP